MGLGIPPLQIKIMLVSNPLKSTMLVVGLAVPYGIGIGAGRAPASSPLVKESLIKGNPLYREILIKGNSL